MIMPDFQSAGALKPLLTVLAEGETHDGVTTVGTSKYLIFFPVLQRTMGLEVKTIASPAGTRFETRTTNLEKFADTIMRELYSEK
jgi:hypothetical protein